MNYCKYVSIDVGTKSEYRESNGNTLPNVQYPFGAQSFVLQTNKSRGGWFYQPDASYIEGIRITNQPSPWLGDYGHITMLPFCGEYDIDLHSSIAQKEHKPDFLSLYINRYNTSVKLVPTKQGAKVLVDNKSNHNSRLLLDCHEGIVNYKYIDNYLYIAIKNINTGELAKTFEKFYCFKFNQPIVNVIKYSNNSQSNNIQLVVEVATNQYEYSIASSYIDFDAVKFHVDKISETDISELEVEIHDKWNSYLGTIEINTEDEEKLKIFYSNLYRCFCFPHVISELTSDGEEVYRNFKTMTIDKGFMIADVGFWDTYRTTMPLLKMLVPNIYKKIISAIINYFDSYGWAPRWLAPYERGIMPSTLVDSIIATAIVDNDVESHQIKSAVALLKKDGSVICSDELFGRDHLAKYLEYGYVPNELECESVSLSLDNYYSDYAIFRALEAVNDSQASEYYLRSQKFSLLFNQDSKLFESKNSNGDFNPKFDNIAWGIDFCESSALQNALNVPHGIAELIDLHGGKEKFCLFLDQIFNMDTQYKVGRYGFEIHEMTEYAKITDLGSFAISNQPSFLMPFWYLHINEEEKFDQIIKKTLKYFTSESDGYPGDEDNGSLSAWYILVNIGFYPFCPVDGLIKFKPQLNAIIKPCSNKVDAFEK